MGSVCDQGSTMNIFLGKVGRQERMLLPALVFDSAFKARLRGDISLIMRSGQALSRSRRALDVVTEATAGAGLDEGARDHPVLRQHEEAGLGAIDDHDRTVSSLRGGRAFLMALQTATSPIER